MVHGAEVGRDGVFAGISVGLNWCGVGSRRSAEGGEAFGESLGS